MSNVVRVCQLGRMRYDEAYRLQKYVSKLHQYRDGRVTAEECGRGGSVKNTLLLLEHHPVYTTGLRECITPEEQKKLENLGAEYRKVDRGGLATFHGPGQLVAYPILNLRHFKPSVKWYVDRLEETAIQTCRLYGIEGKRSEYTGVWIGNKKLCAIGVHVSSGVTTHGLALNCCTDLRWFHHIVPCGIDTERYGVTSLSVEVGAHVEVRHAVQSLRRSFQDVFDCVLVDMTEGEQKEMLETALS